MPPSPGHWHERGGGWRWGPPRGRRPPWWPEGEPWPPAGPEGWRRLRRGFVRRAALFAVGVLLVLVLLVAGVIWLASALIGPHWSTVVGGVGAVLIVALLARWLVRSVRLTAAPIGELIEASARVEAGELGIQVPERGPRDVRALTRTFNTMSARLAETDAQRRRLLADVSHELRTPLTVIQGNVEAMLDGLYPTDRSHLERIRAETAHLERLIEDLRTLALADAGALPLHREPSDLAEIARQAVAGLQPQASAAGVALSVDADDELPELELDPRRVHQVIANLVSNALRHTPRGGRISVAVAADADQLSLQVVDTGSGMTADAVAHAFDRFWRSGEAAGAGLGLAIVRDLVAAHGGRVEMQSAVGAGTTVTCSFPR